MAENTNENQPTAEELANIAQNGRTSDAAHKPDPKDIKDEGEENSAGTEKSDEDKKKEEQASKEKAEKEQKNDDGTWKDEYVTIDNPHATAAIDLLKEAGVSPLEANDYFAEAIKANDLTKVDWARMEKKLGASKTALVKAGVTQYYNDEYAKTHETVQKGYEMFGGEDGWNTVAKHFQAAEKKDPALKQKLNGIRGALDVGGYAAEMALRELKTMYDADPNTKSVKRPDVQRGDKPAERTSQYISQEDYKTKYAKLVDAGDYQGAEKLREQRRASLRQDMQR